MNLLFEMLLQCRGNGYRYIVWKVCTCTVLGCNLGISLALCQVCVWQAFRHVFFNPGNHALMLTARFLLTPFMHLHIPYPLEGSIMTKCLSISLVCIIGTKLNYEYKYVIVKANWQPCGFSELACLPACLPACRRCGQQEEGCCIVR